MGKRLLVKHEDSKEMIFVTISILFFVIRRYLKVERVFLFLLGILSGRVFFDEEARGRTPANKQKGKRKRFLPKLQNSFKTVTTKSP